MESALSLLLCMIALAAVCYTHWNVAQFVRGRARILGLRAFLVVLGAGVGVVMMGIPGSESGIIGFVIGFGLVHVPPAIVLMLKRWRGEGRS